MGLHLVQRRRGGGCPGPTVAQVVKAHHSSQLLTERGRLVRAARTGSCSNRAHMPTEHAFAPSCPQIKALYKLFVEKDCTMVEVGAAPGALGCWCWCARPGSPPVCPACTARVMVAGSTR